MRWVTIISDSVYGRYLRSLSPLLALGPSLAFVCCFSLAETAASGFLGRTKEQTSGHCAEYLWIRRHGSICRGHCRDGAFGTPRQRRRHRGSQRTDWIRHATITPILIPLCKRVPSGDKRHDICGVDFLPEEGDHGDTDLEMALLRLGEQDRSPVLVTFGHMHHRIRRFGGL